MTDETIQLSEREREILAHVASGSTNQKIAHDLGISINTVKVHIRNIFNKIGVSSRTEATVYAVRNGLVAVEPQSEPNTAVVATGDTLAPGSSDTQENSIKEQVSLQHAQPRAEQELTAHMPPAALATPPTAVVGTASAPATNTQAPHAARGMSSRLTVILVVVVMLIGGLAAVFLLPPLLADNQPAGSGSGGLATDETAVSEPETDSTSPSVSRNEPQPTWSTLQPMPSTQCAAAAASLEGDIFVIGGETRDGVTGATWRYNPTSDSWGSRESKPTPVQYAHAAVLNGQIYVPGGQGSDGAISDALEIYNPQQGTWSSGPDLPAPRSAYGLVPFEGLLYLLGGWDGSDVRDEVFVYDPADEEWSQETRLPEPRAYGGAVAIDSNIYVMGGENSNGPLTRNDVYSPEASGGQWSASAALLPAPRSRFGVQVIPPWIILAGGTPEDAPLSYNIRTDTWQTFEAAPKAVGISPAVAQRDASLFVISCNPEEANSETFELRMIYVQILTVPVE